VYHNHHLVTSSKYNLYFSLLGLRNLANGNVGALYVWACAWSTVYHNHHLVTSSKYNLYFSLLGLRNLANGNVGALYVWVCARARPQRNSLDILCLMSFFMGSWKCAIYKKYAKSYRIIAKPLIDYGHLIKIALICMFIIDANLTKLWLQQIWRKLVDSNNP
jgi:branched-subunit amino acid ABC-type transport system permease component